MSSFADARRDSLIRYLQRHVAGEIRFDEPSRHLYATDASLYRVLPLGVVIPRTRDDLITTVQIAGELQVPITARGGGTSLSGQSIGPGIVIDCSKYLNRILDLDPVRGRVRVEPGVVLDHLNQTLAPRGWMFGPDVATASRATLGGMIGNNSAGARSVVYGKTDDHVLGLDMILADGSAVAFSSLARPEYLRKLELRTREGDVYRTVHQVVKAHGEEIDARFPKILRRVSGYNLASLAEQTDMNRSLVPLLVGSEGTLGVMAEAELALVPRLRHRGLLVPHFATLGAALDAVGACLEYGPSAVELLDELLIRLARGQRALSRHMAAVIGEPAALLMVEFSSDSPEDIADRVEKLTQRLRGIPGLTAIVPALVPELRDPLWDLRRASMPLLYGLPGDRKPVTFVEDCAVAPERMPEFAARFREILHQHGTDGSFYGHASVGCLHIRPLLNLHSQDDVQTMRKIMTDVTDLVLAFGGSLSGEHGDGMVRSEWNAKMYGPVIYRAFTQVKAAFDPDNVLNPGRVVHGPAIEENLRVPPALAVIEPPTVMDYTSQGGYFKSIEVCNGAGVCRKTQGGAMCPSFRATRDEKDSTRGRANALREAMTGADAPTDAAGAGRAGADRWLFDVMDLCLSCKACKAECPANVDMAKLKAEFQQAYYARRRRPVLHMLVKHMHTLSPWGARFAGMGNALVRSSWVRRLLQALTGIDRRRSLPELHREHFRAWFAARRQSHTPANPTRRVILLDDCFTTYQEPQIGRAAVRLLETAGYQVELASLCCGRTMISKGFLTDARHLAREGIAKLTAPEYAGVPVLGLEPSCILTLADEWPDLVPGGAARDLASRVDLVESWFAGQVASGACEYVPPPGQGRLLLHPHCHQKALVGSEGTARALRLLTGRQTTVLDAGCCGMAGAFGYERAHYDVSVAIANLGIVPAVRQDPEAAIVATGTSCRHQIRDLTGRIPLHPVEVLAPEG